MRVFSLSCFVFLLCPMISAATASDELFARLDQNQDGQLAADEIEPARQRLFDRLLRTGDENADGKLSADEFRTGLQPTAAEKPIVEKQGSEMPGANALLLILAKMDTNADGQLNAEEVPSQFREFFDRIEDRLGGEKDGLLTRREINQAAPRLSQFAVRMTERMKLDVDLELALLSEKQWQAAQNMTGSRKQGEMLADPNRARQFFKQLDANGDGQLTLAEVPDAVADRFEMLLDRADRNDDDQISEKELMTVSRLMQARMAKSNQPRSKETARAIERMLKQLDRDGDRKVSRKEAPRRLAGRFDQLDTDSSGYLERKEVATLVQSLSAMRRPESSPSERPRKKKKAKK